VLKIYTIAPVIETKVHKVAAYQAFLDRAFADLPGVQVIGRMLKSGPSSIENELDDALAVPGILEVGLAAQADGAHGVLIDCMLDPGLKALRTALDIPVMGTAEIGFRLAAALGNKFGIVDVCDDTGPMVDAQVRTMGLGAQFAGVRGTGLGVEEVTQDETATLLRLEEAATLAIRQDGADVLIFGCTEFSPFTDKLRQRLLSQRLDVPVINPTVLAVGTLVAVVRAGLCHSKRAYPTPQEKKTLRGYAVPKFYQSSET
jgi:allantoin racemase